MSGKWGSAAVQPISDGEAYNTSYTNPLAGLGPARVDLSGAPVHLGALAMAHGEVRGSARPVTEWRPLRNRFNVTDLLWYAIEQFRAETRRPAPWSDRRNSILSGCRPGSTRGGRSCSSSLQYAYEYAYAYAWQRNSTPDHFAVSEPMGWARIGYDGAHGRGGVPVYSTEGVARPVGIGGGK